MKREFKCIGCQTVNQSKCLDLGLQPLANRFKSSPEKAGEYRHPLVLSQCHQCCLIQSLFPVPAEEIRPRYSWIQYREPDYHFDQIAAAIAPLLTQSFSSLGISQYDIALLKRIHAIHPLAGSPPAGPVDLDIKVSPFGMETVQRAFSAGHVKSLAAAKGKYDLVVARYVLEHAEDPLAFLRACRELLSASGLLLIEIPNVRQPLEVKDYHVIWEEHTLYFMEHSLSSLLGSAGFQIEKEILFPSKFERPWLIVAKPIDKRPELEKDRGELVVMESFINEFSKTREQTEQFLQCKISAGFKLMLFGAGHFAVAFVNFFDIEKYIECVIDDDPNKVGKYLAGTSLLITPSESLRNDEKKALIFCVNPDVEEKLKQKFDWLYRTGGVSFSIFARSENYLLKSE